jgi:hypothetical protein
MCNIQTAEFNHPRPEVNSMLTARFLEKGIADFVCNADSECFNGGVCSKKSGFCRGSWGGPQCEVSMQPVAGHVTPIGKNGKPALIETSAAAPPCDINGFSMAPIPLFAVAFLLGVLVSGVIKCVLDKRKQVQIQQQFLKPLLVASD